MTAAPCACPLCGVHAEAFFRSRLPWSVRSDLTPVASPAAVERCPSCGHLFKTAAAVRASADYRSYARVYADSAQGDKMDFAGVPVTRSDALAAHLKKAGFLRDGVTVLDYGCNRGSFLARLPQGRHAGFDVSPRYRPLVEGLGCAYHTPDDPPPAKSFDVLSLIHVLEHLESPAEDMKAGLRALKDGGLVAVQSPDPSTQPTDLYIADHAGHFSAAGLDAVFAAEGFRPVEAPRRLLNGEWTALYRRGKADPAAAIPADDASAIRSALESGEKSLLALCAASGPFTVYGSGNLGTLINAVLEGKVRAFVDDNPAWQGSERWGVPIRPSEALRDGDEVVIAVPGGAGDAVAAKCRGRAGLKVHLPFRADYPDKP